MDDCEMEAVHSVEAVEVIEDGDPSDPGDCVMAELPYSIEENETLGRHLVAQRNLEQGELILSEKPIGKNPSS